MKSHEKYQYFRKKRFDKIYQIQKTFNFNFKMVIYLIDCQIYGDQYNIMVVLCYNYKVTYYSFQKEQKLSNEGYLHHDHNGIWEW